MLGTDETLLNMLKELGPTQAVEHLRHLYSSASYDELFALYMQTFRCIEQLLHENEELQNYQKRLVDLALAL
jgi:hypothetical protein